MRDFYDEAEVRGTYFPETEALVRRVTGASRVIAFDYNLRNRAKQAAGEPGIAAECMSGTNVHACALSCKGLLRCLVRRWTFGGTKVMHIASGP